MYVLSQVILKNHADVCTITDDPVKNYVDACTNEIKTSTNENENKSSTN